MRTIFPNLSIFLGWGLIAWGTLGLGATIPVAYMLFTGQVNPGEPYYVDDLAPTTPQAIKSIAIFFGILFVGFVLKFFAKRWLLITSRSRPTPSARA